MSGSASLSLEQAVLGHTLAFAPMTAPTQVFVALCLAAPAAAPAEATPGTEVSGLGYYRTTATFALATSPANMAANVAAIEFPMALASWGTVGYFELWDAQVGGNRLYWGQLIDHTSGVSATLTVASGDIVRFSPATLGVQAASGVGGVSSSPWLPVAGGTMTGAIALSGNATLPLHAVPLQQLPAVAVPPGGSIQAAHDALPATGGSILLSANTTYVATVAISLTKPNVRLSAPGWGTVIQRGPALAGDMVAVNGTSSTIEGMTIDGNGSVNTTGGGTGYAEVHINGTNCRITNVQCINSQAGINLATSGAGSRIDHCTVIGMGTSLSTERGYGIWAANNVQSFIEHNRITGTGIDGIGANGPGTIVDGNYIAGCHCWTGGPGGQLAIYMNTNSGAGVVVSNNFVGQGGSPVSGGIELNGNNVTVTGNTVVNQYMNGIGNDQGSGWGGNGFVITGNTVINVGLAGGSGYDGIVIAVGTTDFVITGNRIADDQATKTTRYAISVNAGASDRYVISGNMCGPVNDGNVISDGGTGLNKIISGNSGLGVQIAYSAASIVLPTGSVVHLWTTGVTTITSVSAGPFPFGAGTIKWLIPNAAFTFTAGNNIGNAFTSVSGVPFYMIYDEAGKWWLK